jgi:hypothetical protein
MQLVIAGLKANMAYKMSRMENRWWSGIDFNEWCIIFPAMLKYLSSDSTDLILACRFSHPICVITVIGMFIL